MRVDVVTIFPDYLAPLELSLIGRARRAGLLDLRVHDLRDFTHDRHRTVDDTPYGGGAGMVMRPEPWGEALDDVLAAGGRAATPAAPVLSCPSPAGRAVHARPSPSELAGRAVAGRSPAGATRASTSGCSTTPRARMPVRRGLASATTC